MLHIILAILALTLGISNAILSSSISSLQKTAPEGGLSKETPLEPHHSIILHSTLQHYYGQYYYHSQFE
uniref:Uncharacterized protein n=1 Tax=Glossina palpalis gambiensis TaxID=67801 RepID=A0A1B0BBL1_9MUSC